MNLSDTVFSGEMPGPIAAAFHHRDLDMILSKEEFDVNLGTEHDLNNKRLGWDLLSLRFSLRASQNQRS